MAAATPPPLRPEVPVTVINLNSSVAQTLVAARDLRPGQHVYLQGAERVVHRARPYRLFTVVEFTAGRPTRIPHTTALTVWTVGP